MCIFFFFFQAEDGIRDLTVTGVQTCALPIWRRSGLVAPIDPVAVAALLTRHFAGTPRNVLALVTPRAHEMGLMHHAQCLGSVVADFQSILRHPDLDAVDVEHHPGLAGLLDDAAP